MIFQIAKAELRNLFYSPVAWFLAIAFLVQCSWFYTSVMYPIALGSDYMKETYPGWNMFEIYPLTALFFLMNGGLYMTALQNLYLFIPLLTMGLISREINNGTVKLLFSSPVKLRQLVIGKYLAVMVYNLVLVAIIGIFLVTALFNIKSPDYGMLISAALGFYMLTCAYAAIGLFMSSLSTYQIISAIGTFLVIFVLSRIGTLWQDIPFVSDLIYFLDLSGRTRRSIAGLIASRDIIYFAMVIWMFLGFTMVRLRNAREKKPWYIKSMRIVLVITSAVLIGYVCSLPQTRLYLDLTEHEKNTIHPITRQLLEEIGDDELEVTLYTNLLGREATYGLPVARNAYLTTMWEQYLRFKPDIKFKYEYYYHYDPSIDGGVVAKNFPGKSSEDIAKDVAKIYKVNLNLFKRSEEMKNIVDLGTEGHRLIMQLKYKGRTEFLRTYTTGIPFPGGEMEVFPDEMNTTAALKRLVHPETKPRIVYSTGHFERSISKGGEREYWQTTLEKSRKMALINNGFEFDTVALDKQEIPENTTVLVLADPRSALTETEQQKLKNYIDRGGNMVILGEPGKQEILNPVLRQLGVEFMDGTVVEPTFHEMPQMVKVQYTPTTVNIGDEIKFRTIRMQLKSKYVYDTSKMLMPGVAALAKTDSSGFDIKPLLLTKANGTWVRKGNLVTDSAAITYHPEEGDVKGPLPTGLQLSRKVGNREQRIVILGDADYNNNRRFPDVEPFNRTIYHWITGESYPVYLPKPIPSDNSITVTAPTMKLLGVIYLWVLPAVILAIAIVLLVRRKRK